MHYAERRYLRLKGHLGGEILLDSPYISGSCPSQGFCKGPWGMSEAGQNSPGMPGMPENNCFRAYQEHSSISGVRTGVLHLNVSKIS